MPRIANPWFRVYTNILTNRKVQNLEGTDGLQWMNLMAIANVSEPRGSLPDVKEIAFQIRQPLDFTDALVKRLVKAKLVGRRDGRYVMHDWDEWQRNSDAYGTAGRRDRHAEGTPLERATAFLGTAMERLDRDKEEDKKEDRKKEREEEKDAPTALTLPFVLAYVGKYQGRTAGGRPSPIQHSELVSIERHYGSELCFQAAAAKGWDKPASYLRGWLNDHAGQANEPETRDEAIARLSRPTSAGIPDALEDTDRVADGIYGLDGRSLAVARLGRGG